MDNKKIANRGRYNPLHDSVTEPDQSVTIGDLIERHIEGVSNHQNEAYEDVNIDDPMRYDTDLTDVPTPYQDGEYFDRLNGKGISTDDILPSNGNPNEQNTEYPPSNQQGVESSS